MAMRIIIEDTGQPAGDQPGVEVTRSAGVAGAASDLSAASDAGPPPDHLLAARDGGASTEEPQLGGESGETQRQSGGLDGTDAGPPDMSLAELISSLSTGGQMDANGQA